MALSPMGLRERLRTHEHRRFILAALITVGLLLLVALATLGWYTFRVWTELGPRPWANPTVILARDGSTILEIYGDQWRPGEPIVIENLPDHVPHAFLAAEDVRFRRHIGIDPWGIGRAALANIKEGGVTQGGSTITQQVAKTRFLSAERTFRRKIMEVFVAVLIEARLPKDDILGAYLNDVYLGHNAGSEILGIDEAARIYFDRGPGELSVAQAALLAAMVRAPNQDDQELMKARRDAVLEAMHEEGWLDESELGSAREEPVSFTEGSLTKPKHRYYLSALRSELVDTIGARRLRGGALKIHTAWDPAMQSAAVDAVVGGVDRLRSRYSWLRQGEDPLQGALLSADPETGGVRALVGGVSYVKSQFDRSHMMERQPGSAIKPFVYATAIERKEITPASILSDEPVEIELSRNDIWSPHNYDDDFRGDVTVREAVEKSLNVPLVRLTEEIGVRSVRRMLKKAGFDGELSDTSAIALGVDEVSMWELVEAYTTFPNLGRKARLHFVERVESIDGDTIYEFDHEGREILEPAAAYVIHSMLRGVVERGTASALSGQLGAVAGKTGTTSDYRDAWFLGYSPDLVTATWVGFDQGEPLRISSAEAALPVWSRYMSAVNYEKGELSPPEGVTIETVERRTGLLWQQGCGSPVEEAFIEGTAPSERCQPRARPEPEPERFIEPPVISVDTLREWLEETPEIFRDMELEPTEREDAPPGAEPGDIIIEIPEQEPDTGREPGERERGRPIERDPREPRRPPADTPDDEEQQEDEDPDESRENRRPREPQRPDQPDRDDPNERRPPDRDDPDERRPPDRNEPDAISPRHH